MYGVFPQRDTKWPESEPSSALPDTSSLNLRGLGLLDTGKAFIKCGYTPCPETCTHTHTQLISILLKGLKRDNPACTLSIDTVKYIIHMHVLCRKKFYDVYVSAFAVIEAVTD